MAINPEAQYPGKIAPSTPSYPYGQARNITIPGDGTGTPWEAALVNDVFGFQQALLSLSGIIPSGSPETALVSQYVQALGFVSGRVVQSLSDARDLEIIQGQKLFLSGSDGGLFRGITGAAPATYTDDDPTYAGMEFIPSGGDGSAAWVRVDALHANGSAIVRPEWYGSTRNGVAEDGPSLQKAITKAETVKFSLLLTNGTYLNDTTDLISINRIRIIGGNKEDCEILTTSTGVVTTILEIGIGGGDTEEWFLENFTIRCTGEVVVGLQIEPSYGRLTNMRVFEQNASSTAYTTAAVQTSTTTNVNQIVYDNCEIRSQSNPGGFVGLWHRRGANISFLDGYYGDFDTCVRLGDGSNFVSNITIDNGIYEVFDPQNSATACCIELLTVTAIRISTRFQLDNLLQRGIRVTGQLRGFDFSGCSMDGTGAADAMIEFDGNTPEQARGGLIGFNDWNSVGSPTTWPVVSFSKATASIITGVTQANPAVVTTSAAHGLSNGDRAWIYGVVGTTQVNNLEFIAANVTATTLELQGIDSTAYGAYVSGGNIAKMAAPTFDIGSNSHSATANRPLVNQDVRDGATQVYVTAGNLFILGSSAATITDLLGVEQEDVKEVWILATASHTIQTSGGNIRGNGGGNYTPAAAEMLNFKKYDTLWYLVGK